MGKQSLSVIRPEAIEACQIFTHQECGWVWLNMLLKRMHYSCVYMGENEVRKYVNPHTRESVIIHGNTDHVALSKNISAVHIIRDPRDVAVSAYLAHMNVGSATTEVFRHCEKIQAMSREKGFLEDIKWSSLMPFGNRTARLFDGLNAFNRNAEVSVLRWEYLVANPYAAVQSMMRSVNLRTVSDALLIRILDDIGIENLLLGDAKSGVGATSEDYVYPGAWKNYFTTEIKGYFKINWGPLLIELGYEKDNDW